MGTKLNGDHALTPHTGPAFTDDDLGYSRGCCYGDVIYGPDHCTCWVPVLDLEQVKLDTTTEATTRAKCCHDCAYRQGSPERDRGEGDELEDLAGSERRVFWCHEGMRKVLSWRHPDGRERPHGGTDHYVPLIVDQIPYRADGTAGERCAGWASLHEALSKPEAVTA